MAEPCVYCGGRVRYESRRNEAEHALSKFNISTPGWPLMLFCCTTCEKLHSEEILQAAFARVGPQP
jgi:hypothetical protein